MSGSVSRIHRMWAGGVLARMPRRPSGQPDPALELADVVAEHVHEPRRLALDGRAAPGVHPDHGRPQRGTVGGRRPPCPTTAPCTPARRSGRRRRHRRAQAPSCCRHHGLHQAAGSCSAPPPGSRCRATGSKALARIVPGAETRATLGPPVPRSTASTSTGIAKEYCRPLGPRQTDRCVRSLPPWLGQTVVRRPARACTVAACAVDQCPRRRVRACRPDRCSRAPRR